MILTGVTDDSDWCISSSIYKLPLNFIDSLIQDIQTLGLGYLP